MQPPVPGTIARGELVLHYRATPEDAVRAGRELSNPVPSEAKEHAASVDRGRKVFQIYCTPCHGGGGLADGLVVKHGYPPPPSLLTGKTVPMPDGQLFHILTYGQGNMAAFAGQLSPEERWDVINLIRSLQADEVARVKAEAAKAEAAKKKAEQVEGKEGQGDKTQGEPKKEDGQDEQSKSAGKDK